jgi:hypothetical protein
MIQLLREHEVARKFRDARKRAKESIVAVAFWGNGAAKTLGLATGTRVRVICNLDHPGCNPDAIEELQELKIKVRSNPRLHAKIYATEHVAVVGSSNVSTNGLTVEGADATGWIEANVLTDDPTFLGEVHLLFEQIWSDSRPVRKSDIKGAREARKNWPKPFPSPKKTLLAECRAHPSNFRSVYVFAYEEDLGPHAQERMAALRSGAQPPKPGLSEADFRKAWGYQADIPSRWVIDLNCINPSRIKCSGTSQMIGLRLKVAGEEDLRIAIPGPVVISGYAKPFRLSTSEKESLEGAASRILEKKEYLLPLPEALNIIDG